MAEWRSPETAPKDRVILADFGWPWAVVARWSVYANEWVVAAIQANMCDGLDDPSWITESEGELLGWIEMPEVLRG